LSVPAAALGRSPSRRAPRSGEFVGHGGGLQREGERDRALHRGTTPPAEGSLRTGPDHHPGLCGARPAATGRSPRSPGFFPVDPSSPVRVPRTEDGRGHPGHGALCGAAHLDRLSSRRSDLVGLASAGRTRRSTRPRDARRSSPAGPARSGCSARSTDPPDPNTVCVPECSHTRYILCSQFRRRFGAALHTTPTSDRSARPAGRSACGAGPGSCATEDLEASPAAYQPLTP